MESRIKRLQESFDENNIDCFLVTSNKNIYYLTGYTGDAGILFVSPRKARLITDYRFQGEITDKVENAEVCLTRKNYIDELSSQRLVKRKERIGFEAKDINYSLYWKLRKKLDWLKFKSFDSLIENFRLIKNEEEIDYIEEACRISDKAFKEVLDYIEEGVKEIEIAAELEYRMKKAGGEKAAFDTIVASGYRSSIPHGVASHKELKSGEFITIDFGTIYKGYNSDMTRTVFLGQPTGKDRKIYNTVFSAQKKAREAIRKKMKLKELDSIARDYIKEEGYGDYFTHSLGHGIGLSVHESPAVSYKNDDGEVDEGMVFTIEPGVYIPDYQGVRIEDTVAVYNGRKNVLTGAERELLEL